VCSSDLAKESAGHFYVQLQVVVPPSVSDEERVLYERLAGLSNYDPRPDFPKD
jgi:DnaJ-class molecular chaperone